MSLSENVLRRLEQAGLHTDVPTLNIVADILHIVRLEIDGRDTQIELWEIPDMIDSSAGIIRKEANILHVTQLEIQRRAFDS